MPLSPAYFERGTPHTNPAHGTVLYHIAICSHPGRKKGKKKTISPDVLAIAHDASVMPDSNALNTSDHSYSHEHSPMVLAHSHRSTKGWRNAPEMWTTCRRTHALLMDVRRATVLCVRVCWSRATWRMQRCVVGERYFDCLCTCQVGHVFSKQETDLLSRPILQGNCQYDGGTSMRTSPHSRILPSESCWHT